ncbi:unnamed protein product [Cunninghamella echinulata]
MTSGLTIYHNSQCSKSRTALSYLEENKEKDGYELQVCHYQKDPPSRDILETLSDYLGLKDKDASTRPWDVLLRPEGKKKVNSLEEAWDLIEENPSLLERPFVIDWDNKKAAIGRSVAGHQDLSSVEELVENYNKNKK